MNTLRAFSLLVLSIGIFSCDMQKSADEVEFSLASDSALFQNVNMGDAPAEVRKSETGVPVFLSDTLMNYQTRLQAGKEEIETTVYYNFDEFGLFEIQADLFISGSERDSLFEKMNTHLTGKYGRASRRVESLSWTTPSASNTLIEISLSKEIDMEGNPFISLNYLEPLNEQL